MPLFHDYQGTIIAFYVFPEGSLPPHWAESIKLCSYILVCLQSYYTAEHSIHANYHNLYNIVHSHWRLVVKTVSLYKTVITLNIWTLHRGPSAEDQGMEDQGAEDKGENTEHQGEEDQGMKDQGMEDQGKEDHGMEDLCKE